MKTEAIFDNISTRIKNEIEKAEKTIYIAVAWFTNKELFEVLLDKVNKGCNAYLIVSNDEINTKINFNLLETEISKCYKVGNGNSELMHNKFCIIDDDTVITGSYNWSYKASSNFENIVITKGDNKLAKQFITEFNNILAVYFPHDIKASDVPNTSELKKYNEKSFFSLKLEIKMLEYKIMAFENEKIELNKLLSDFHHRHFKELGNLILQILEFRKMSLDENSDEYKDVEKDQKKYKENLFNEKNKIFRILSIDEKIELKKKYRKASILCHPDKVVNDFKEQAQEIFIKLQLAYSENDLDKVSQILTNLQNNNFSSTDLYKYSKKSKLENIIGRLKKLIMILENDIKDIRQNPTYKLIVEIQDFDEYFKTKKEQLLKELAKLKKSV